MDCTAVDGLPLALAAFNTSTTGSNFALAQIWLRICHMEDIQALETGSLRQINPFARLKHQ
jgi:hypothetical protein